MNKINHPPHYGGDNPYETIRVLEAWLSIEELKGFYKGNAIKYISRAGKKGDELDDFLKAKWYIKRLIKMKKFRKLKKILKE